MRAQQRLRCATTNHVLPASTSHMAPPPPLDRAQAASPFSAVQSGKLEGIEGGADNRIVAMVCC